MDRNCDACGREPGEGAFCQHCGTGLFPARPTDPVDRDADADAGAAGEPPDEPTPTPTPAAPRPEPTPTPTSAAATSEPTPQPQVVYVQAPSAPPSQPSSGSALKGCGIAVLVVALLLAAAAYLGWRWYRANVAPTVEGIGTALEDGFAGFEEGGDAVGPCYDLEFDDDGIVSAWSDVDCGGSRDAEVFHRWMFRDGSHPGMEALEDEALSTCTAWFEDYVGVPYAESSLRFEWLVPTEALWSGGRRDGVCTVRAASGPLTGPVKGSQR